MAYSTIIKPSDYFNPKLYTGTGASNAITGVGFQPDFTWIKERAGAAHDHNLTDAVRGVTKSIRSNTAGVETTDAQDLKTFDSNGFTVGTNGGVNENNINFVSWNWKANGLGSSNTDGTINSTYTSANTTSKCSIVKWVGTGANATVGHGLGVAPTSIWVKNLSASESWVVYHKSLGATHYLTLDSTAGDYSGGAGAWNSTVPTANVFSLGTFNSVNKPSSNMIAYCFADVSGYSKFSNYYGNNNVDGTFIYTGFKPAWIMLKRTDAAGDNWLMFDNKRAGYNVENYYLSPDTPGAEGTTDKLDIVSNGFKLRTTGGDTNQGLFVYWAFAETPFVSNVGESLPTTAR